MKNKGSITVFFSLILTVILSLILTLILSAKVQAGRAQIAIAMDQAMYSMLARYDRELIEQYHLLYLDAGYGTGALQLGKTLDELESDLSYLFMPNKEKEYAGGNNFLNLRDESGSITGYTLATDGGGKVFKEQAVQYMKDTLGIQGISALFQKLTGQKELAEKQENQKAQIKAQGTVEDFEELQKEAQSNEEAPGGDGQGENHSTQTPEENASALEGVKVMGSVAILKKTSLLNLVVKNPEELSGWTSEEGASLQERSVNQGMGLIEVSPETEGVTADILFQEYLLRNLNHYQANRHGTGPRYGVEHVLQGKSSDVENLEGVVHKLLLMREAANVLHLYTDGAKRAQVTAMAAALSALFLNPSVAPVIEAAIIMGWAFVESLVDVRGLLAGGKVPLIKTGAAWQVGFSDIPNALGGLDGFQKNNGSTGYEDYLRLLLFIKSDDKKIAGCMEVVEWTMRGIPGKEAFSMDRVLDTLEVEWKVRSENKKTFTIVEKRSYRTY